MGKISQWHLPRNRARVALDDKVINWYRGSNWTDFKRRIFFFLTSTLHIGMHFVSQSVVFFFSLRRPQSKKIVCLSFFQLELPLCGTDFQPYRTIRTRISDTKVFKYHSNVYDSHTAYRLWSGILAKDTPCSCFLTRKRWTHLKWIPSREFPLDVTHHVRVNQSSPSVSSVPLTCISPQTNDTLQGGGGDQ